MRLRELILYSITSKRPRFPSRPSEDSSRVRFSSRPKFGFKPWKVSPFTMPCRICAYSSSDRPIPASGFIRPSSSPKPKLKLNGDAADATAPAEDDEPAAEGPAEDGPALIETYIKHRQEREDQIVHVLESANEGEEMGEPQRLWGIVQTIYKAYPQSLWGPAAHGIGLHLKKLQDEGKVKHIGGQGIDSTWELCRL